MDDREKHILEVMKKNNQLASKEILGGMWWDDVCWNVHYLIDDFGYTEDQLKEMFPCLM